MKKIIVFLLLSLSSITIFSQNSLKELLHKNNNEAIPYVTVKKLQRMTSNVTVLDARELKEYKTSHIKNAIHVGYDHFNIENTVRKLSSKKDSPIVVYCSLGIRSEDVAEQLKAKGYTQVYNLYGGIFEWKNENGQVYNIKNQPTEKVHTFNKDWSVWLKKGIKVYE